MLGIVFVGTSIFSGVQDGIAQGFESFGPLAKVKIAISLVVVTLIYPVANAFGLSGVLCLILVALVVKVVVLRRLILQSKERSANSNCWLGSVFSCARVRFCFSIDGLEPDTRIRHMVGYVHALEKPEGFDGVAIVNTGLQWRAPVLLLAASLGGVAIPAFSRLRAQGDAAASKTLRRTLALLNLGMASIVAVVVIGCSGPIMQLYGEGFAQRTLAFAIIVLSTVPTVVANVYMQELVGAAQNVAAVLVACPLIAMLADRHSICSFRATLR